MENSNHADDGDGATTLQPTGWVQVSPSSGFFCELVRRLYEFASREARGLAFRRAGDRILFAPIFRASSLEEPLRDGPRSATIPELRLRAHRSPEAGARTRS